MNPDEHHVALPKLYGAPAYARPPRVFDASDRPLDPDDLPLEVYRADDWSVPSPAPASLGPERGTVSLAAAPPSVAVAEPVGPPEPRGVAGPVESAEPVAPGAADPAESSATESDMRPRALSVRALRDFLQRR